jgi:hypothetical protein
VKCGHEPVGAGALILDDRDGTGQCGGPARVEVREQSLVLWRGGWSGHRRIR